MADYNTSSLLTVQPYPVSTVKARLFESLKCQTPVRLNSLSSSNLPTLSSRLCDIHGECGDKSFVENPGLESAVCDSAFASSRLTFQDSEHISCAYNNSITVEGASAIQVREDLLLCE